ncbi:formate dehydrogenase accessory sulfurtransferase FdhD [Kordiimonas marina]|uniref:formate dehydrogenase accessory sulfurtransferase FdhD n=1 Tax=Kordiimonas marina TaxID=2872312 RepID=UPI001FF33468|nr:formate dehydrogenase accessory sulfurtransferase FdhD [Kordiimonas marina]MCJ9427722.1 formate dehydrogenase accessory sulfurtransferase FdhD [Kordiimonas marina]
MKKHWQADVVMEGAEDGEPVSWHLPEEAPVALIYNGVTYAVMLASPADLTDFAVGFSLSERVVDAVADIAAIDIREREQGIDIHMTISARAAERLSVREHRNITGRTGCGLCGIDSAERLFQPLPKVSETPMRIERSVVAVAAGALEAKQPMRELNRSVHGAAWAGMDGAIHLVREDVGRHNAIDKLLGARARAGETGEGFVLMTSRASYEIVEKAVFRGVKALVTLSAPTAFAVRRAREAGLMLANYNGGHLTIF